MNRSRILRPSHRTHPLPAAALWAALAAGCLSAVLPAAPLGAQEPPAILGLDEIQRGQRGYGLSVFAGSEPERFEVEVLGVIRNNSPGSSFILARLSGEPGGVSLEESGVIQGMSGSPVFIEDRLVGAVAFSWSFTNGAVAGITPIEQMRRLYRLPAASRGASGSPPVALDRLLAGELPEDLLENQLRRLTPATAAGHPVGLQWSASGFGDSSRQLLERRLGSVAPMGGGVAMADADPAAAERSLVPGGAVAAVLVDGDLRLAGTGTVTDRDGEKVLAFGHPFLGLGPIRVPMAAAEIVTVVSNKATSFKIANLGPRVGSFEQDRLMGIQGRLGVEAPMVPVEIRIGAEGAEAKVFHVEVASLPLLTPTLVAVATLGALDVAQYTAGDIGLDLDARFHLSGGHGELRAVQSFDGSRAVTDLVQYLLAMAGFLLQNDFERLDLDSVEVHLQQTDRPRTVNLVGAHSERSVVRPGEQVALHLDLVPYRGAPFRRSLEVEIPGDVPDGRYFLFVGDGASLDAARLALEPAEPITLAQALRLLRSFHTRRQLGALGVFAGQGLSVAGEVLPRLPGSVASIWGAAASGDARPLRQVVAYEHFQPLEQPLDGLVRIDLTVRRREPLTPGPAGSPAPERGAAEGTIAPGSRPEERSTKEGL